MKDEQRLIEIMADVLAELHVIGGELKELRKDTNSRLDNLGGRMERVEKEQAKTNIALGELRLSILKLAERDNIIEDHESRLKFLENKISKAS